jgi:hypothetical protein
VRNNCFRRLRAACGRHDARFTRTPALAREYERPSRVWAAEPRPRQCSIGETAYPVLNPRGEHRASPIQLNDRTATSNATDLFYC